MTRPSARALAFAICSLLATSPASARADDSAVVSTVPAPQTYAKVPWKHGDSIAIGYWYSAAQVQRIDARIRYLEDKAAKDCVDAQIGAAKKTSVWLKVAGVLITGAAIGYCAGADHRCGVK